MPRPIQVNPDQLQNILLSLQHHANDAREAIETGNAEVALASINDIDEIVNEMKTALPAQYQKAFGNTDIRQQPHQQYQQESVDPEEDVPVADVNIISRLMERLGE